MFSGPDPRRRVSRFTNPAMVIKEAVTSNTAMLLSGAPDNLLSWAVIPPTMKAMTQVEPQMIAASFLVRSLKIIRMDAMQGTKRVMVIRDTTVAMGAKDMSARPAAPKSRRTMPIIKAVDVYLERFNTPTVTGANNFCKKVSMPVIWKVLIKSAPSTNMGAASFKKA